MNVDTLVCCLPASCMLICEKLPVSLAGLSYLTDHFSVEEVKENGTRGSMASGANPQSVNRMFENLHALASIGGLFSEEEPEPAWTGERVDKICR